MANRLHSLVQWERLYRRSELSSVQAAALVEVEMSKSQTTKRSRTGEAMERVTGGIWDLGYARGSKDGWNAAIEASAKAVEGAASGYLPGGPIDMKGVYREAAVRVRALKKPEDAETHG